MIQPPEAPPAPVVHLAGQAVTLRLPDPLAAWHVFADFAASQPEKQAVLLRLCWTGPGRPGAPGVDTRDTAACGQAVARDLLSRGVKIGELVTACVAAWSLCFDAYYSAAVEVEDTADFFEAPAAGSASS